ncbi:hypothetical protein PCE1_001928 [Barthelona sp. PCE]
MSKEIVNIPVELDLTDLGQLIIQTQNFAEHDIRTNLLEAKIHLQAIRETIRQMMINHSARTKSNVLSGKFSLVTPFKSVPHYARNTHYNGSIVTERQASDILRERAGFCHQLACRVRDQKKACERIVSGEENTGSGGVMAHSNLWNSLLEEAVSFEYVKVITSDQLEIEYENIVLSVRSVDGEISFELLVDDEYFNISSNILLRFVKEQYFAIKNKELAHQILFPESPCKLLCTITVFCQIMLVLEKCCEEENLFTTRTVHMTLKSTSMLEHV